MIELRCTQNVTQFTQYNAEYYKDTIIRHKVLVITPS